jgi:endonuclease YncB( thermonuclease family)
MSPQRRRYNAKKALIEALEIETQIFRTADPSQEQQAEFKLSVEDRWKVFERDYPSKPKKEPKPDPAIKLALEKEQRRNAIRSVCDREIEKLKFENASADRVFAAELKKVKLIQEFDNPKPKVVSDESAPVVFKMKSLPYKQKIRLQRLNTHLKRQRKEEGALIKAGNASKDALEKMRYRHEIETAEFHKDEDRREEERAEYFRNRNKHGKNYNAEQVVAKINAGLQEMIVLETARLKRKLDIEAQIAQNQIDKVLAKQRSNAFDDK